MSRKSLTKQLFCSLALVAFVGCSTGKDDGWKFTKSWDVRKAVGLKKDEPAPPQIPTRLVSTWQDAVLNRPGQKSQRGFGGRLLFFSEESDDPVRVEGQLVVYAYDEQGRAAHETHPTRRYVFPLEQFVRHESECQLGPSYSVWLPWDEVGGKQKNISLIARFEPNGGALIAGDQTRHLLPGIRTLANGETAPPTEQVGDIRLTEYTQASNVQANAVNSTDTRRQVTSIALSQQDWAQRLAAAQADAAPKTREPSAATALPGPARP